MAPFRLDRLPPRPLRRLLPHLLVALALPWQGATPAAADGAASADLDALVQSTLDGVPTEKASEVVSWILEAYQGTTGYHGVSPGSLFQTGSPSQDLVLDTASGSLSVDFFGGACVYAPIHLPQGATITSFILWVRDNNSSEDSTASLRRRSVNGATGIQELAAITSSGSTSGSRIFSDFTISNGFVDNNTYWYFVYVCLPALSDTDGPTELRGLYISYTN
ncbi:MAG: hypothetical protein KDB94_13430 [Acidobacteria bacterium]|nr:hypothetical protein [Acidobacteriota bacterium]